jgi:hypothetical protein
MAQLWLRTRGEWAALPLDADRLPLEDLSGRSRAVLVRSAGGWMLLAAEPEAVRVNGLPVALLLRALRDRDEIRVAGLGTIYFSSERLAQVVVHPGSGSLPCARCQVGIAAGDPAVACPQCNVWHHAGRCRDGVDRECWTYAEHCAFCPQPTSPDAGFQWTPEAL